MIAAVCAEELCLLEKRFGKDPFGCRAVSLLRAYGTNTSFVRAWTGGEKQAPDFLLVLFDESAILSCAKNPEYEYKELSSFLRMLPGAKRLLCGYETGNALDFPLKASGPVLRFCGENPQPEETTEINPSPRELYPVLEAAAGLGFVPPPFEAFYVDLSYRIRHGSAISAGVRRKGKIVSCAICSGFTRESACLSAVCTLPKERGKGYGSLAVNTLIRELKEEVPEREVFLLRSKRENEAFYAQLGFNSCGWWCELCLF